MKATRGRSRQQGFLIIAGVFLVVVLAALVGYLMTVSTTSQAASGADMNSARAYQAARAGNEWAIWRLLQGAGGAGVFETQCESASPTRNLTIGTFTATVTCSSTSTTEGASTVRTYTLVSNACNIPSGGACPNASSTSATYVERELRLTVTK